MIRRRPVPFLWAAAALFAAACLVILFRAEGWLASGPRFGSEESPLVIEGERLLECLPTDDRRVGRLPDGARLYANLDMVFHAFTEDEATTLYIVARGSRLHNIPPLLTVDVDRKLRGHIVVDSNDWQLYRLDLKIPTGGHRFRIRYINDRSRFPTNRDVDLRLVAIGAPPAGWEPSTSLQRAESLFFYDSRHVVQEDGSLALYSSGYLGRDYSVTSEQEVRLTVVARGDTCAGAGPRMLIMDNDDQLVAFEVDATIFQPYETVLTLAPGRHEILIVYENDLYVPGVCDRNLHVREMRLEEL